MFVLRSLVYNRRVKNNLRNWHYNKKKNMTNNKEGSINNMSTRDYIVLFITVDIQKRFIYFRY